MLERAKTWGKGVLAEVNSACVCGFTVAVRFTLQYYVLHQLHPLPQDKWGHTAVAVDGPGTDPRAVIVGCTECYGNSVAVGWDEVPPEVRAELLRAVREIPET